jgi:hypothetical protein
MDERTYTINELKTLISESASEMKAKIGDDVKRNNKQNSETTYSDAKKKAKSLGGDLKSTSVKNNVPEKEDGNKTTLDYALEGEPGKDFRDKIKAQAEGYTSTLEKNNGI